MDVDNSNKIQLKAFGLGQLISVVITGTGVCSELLAFKYAVNIPTAQSLFVYVLLGLVYSLVLVKKGTWLETVKSKWKFYLPLALVDVEGNYFVVKAYQYTTITSIMLLDCFTIPCVMILTYVFLKTRYNWRHYVGVGLCLVGLAILIYSDTVFNNANEGGSNKILGDLLCLVGAVLYSISNVGQEAMVTKFDKYEYLAMIGLYGAPISLVQLVILERDQLNTLTWSWPIVGLLFGFTAFLFTMYSLVPLLLTLSGSAFFNLSLLTSDVYAIIFGVFLFGKIPSVLYFIAFVIILVGLCFYNIKNNPVMYSKLEQSESTSIIRKPPDEEDSANSLDSPI
jgi:solute carrier family 35 protein F1/2